MVAQRSEARLNPAAARSRPVERAAPSHIWPRHEILERLSRSPSTTALANSASFAHHLHPCTGPSILRRFGVIFVLLLPLPLVTFEVHQLLSLFEQLALCVQGFGSCTGA